MPEYTAPDYTAQIAEFTAQAQQGAEQYLATVAKVQETVVEAIAAFVKQIPAAPEVPGVPAVDLTAPGKITAATFDFAEKLLAQNRTYADQIFAALVPATV